ADAGARRLAARGLGQVGERESVPLLAARLGDADPAVRIAAAAALLGIIGLDPKLLARASVDWARSALASEDWATRESAAALVGEEPEHEGVVLLAQALGDTQPEVRRAAAKSAARLKGKAAAKAVAGGARTAKDPAAGENMVRALWTMREPETKDTLAAMAAEPGRAGVLAAGALMALGDDSGKQRVEEGMRDAAPEMRSAAIEAAREAKLMPTLAQ